MHKLAKSLMISVMLMLMLISLSATAQVNEDVKITASDGATSDQFGTATDADGNRTLVGAPGDEIGIGAAYIFEFDGTNVVETKLTASDGAPKDAFGVSVSLSGNRALVGASEDDDNGENSGSAYVFEFDGTNWVEIAKLTASDGAPADLFGISVSLFGNRALVGSPFKDNSTGAVYLFEFDGTDWVEVAKLTASDGAPRDQFGFSISISGDRALVGASGGDDNGESSGSAYVFEFNGTRFVETFKLTASDGAPNDVFGISVSLSGDRALVGASGGDDNGESSGSAYVFEFNGTRFVETFKLTASDGAPNDVFGRFVSLLNERVLIGAFGDDAITGSAYVFEFDGTRFEEVAKLTASDGAPRNFFGASVSLSDDRAVVGASADDDKGELSGSVFLFELDGAVEEGNIHIADIQIRAFQNKRGKFRIKATVLVVDGDGNRVPLANVSGRFLGDANTTEVKPTNTRGLAKFNEVVNIEPRNFLFCVETITNGPFAYDRTKNRSAEFDCRTISNKRSRAQTDLDRQSIEDGVPEAFALNQNYPNPFNPTTMISYAMSEAGAVRLSVYNMLGEEVATLIDGHQEAGVHQVRFDASHLSAGMYIYTMKVGAVVQTRKLTLLK